MENWSTNSFGSESAKAEDPPDFGSLLPIEFYRRNTLEVARDLLGKTLVVSVPSGVTAARIVETEAYRGTDPASHSARGKTPRCSVMFGEAGIAYVYFIYGMYEMLNFVTEPEGEAGAVLIRSVEPLFGADLMAKRRGVSRSPRFSKDSTSHPKALTSGPGRLCQAMGVEMRHNGESLMGPVFQVFQACQADADDGEFNSVGISCSPRVGISAGREKYWRYFLTDHPFVSRSPQNAMAKTWRVRSRRK